MDGQNNVRKAGRPVAEMIELTVVCFKKVSPNTIPKIGRSLWFKLKKKHIKKIIIYKTDNISEKIRKEFNLNQGWKLYNVKSGKPIEVNDELDFKSIKSNMTKKNRRLYIGPDTHDIRDIGSSNNHLDADDNEDCHVYGPVNAENGLNDFNCTSTINSGHTNGLPCGSNSFYSTSTNEGFMNHNLDSSFTGTFTNGNVSNQLSRGYTTVNAGITTSRISTFPVSDSCHNFIGSVNTDTSANAFTIPNDFNYDSTSTIVNRGHTNGLSCDSNSFYSTSTNEGFMNDDSYINTFTNGNISNQSSRSGLSDSINRFTIGGIKYLSFKVEHAPENGDFIKIENVIYQLIREDKIITDVSTSTNGGYNNPLVEINTSVPSYNNNAATHFDRGYLNPFSNNNYSNDNVNYQISESTNNIQPIASTSPSVGIPNDFDVNIIVNGIKNAFQNDQIP